MSTTEYAVSIPDLLIGAGLSRDQADHAYDLLHQAGFGVYERASVEASVAPETVDPLVERIRVTLRTCGDLAPDALGDTEKTATVARFVAQAVRDLR